MLLLQKCLYTLLSRQHFEQWGL
uniref:Uncharacterized protein n=1 Tax=Anguilla anguilla TaxID=7936 RepID=A0A0E9W3C2_ANGAN